MSPVIVKTYTAPPFCEKEALRYAGCRTADEQVRKLLYACLNEVDSRLTYKVCCLVLPVMTGDGRCDFGSFSVRSQQLEKQLAGCRSVLLFGATIGVEMDRLVARYARLSPAKAVMLQAVGAERIEALCDAFCADFAEENGVFLKPRFSPGYGDLPLDVQKEIFAVLDCPRKIGLSLNDSLLMLPTKSVTAFAGITDVKTEKEKDKCSRCDNADCAFRSTV